MLELKLPRLLAAAKEFNVGQDTIVDFLVAKGFNRDDLKPTAKLSEEMYRSLQHQFQGDKVAKNKADLVEIPKGVQQEGRKKRDEEEITFNKKDFAKPAAPQPVPEAAPQPSAETKLHQVAAEVALPLIQEVMKPQAQSEPESREAKAAAEIKPDSVEEDVSVSKVSDGTAAASPNAIPDALGAEWVRENEQKNRSFSYQQVQENQPVALKIDAPEIEGPKVIAKIDLSAIDSSTRPKKGVAKPVELKTVSVEPAVKQPAAERASVEQSVAVSAPVFKVQPQPEVPFQPKPEPAPNSQSEFQAAESLEVAPVLSNIKAEKIEGPKILGKIELPVETDTRPKQGIQEKRKRKRIPVPVDRKGAEQGNRDGSQQLRHTPGQFHGQTAVGTGPNNRFGPRSSELPGAQQRSAQSGGGPGTGFNSRAGAGTSGGGFNRPGQAPGSGQANRQAPSPNGATNRFGPRSSEKRREDKEIDQKEIQDKIRETQAKLAGGSGRGKSLKAKYRKAKRDGVADLPGHEGDDNKLLVTEFISVSELANLMDVSFAEVIGKCMSLGLWFL